ncbi:MAG: hypothetical protein LBJ01_03045 [Tannerella sp.]|nr:hypothetical protein [Tannerella sp.]
MTQRSLPGFKGIEYGNPASLFIDSQELIEEGGTVAAYGSFTGIPTVSLCGCSVTAETVGGETVYTTVLNFQMKDCEDHSRRLISELVMTDCCFRLTDVYGKKYLLGLDKRPYPTVKPSFRSESLPSGQRAFSVEITYINTVSLLLLA